MSNTKIIAKNTAVLFLGDVIGRVLSFLIIILISRYLGDIGMGYYGFIFAFVGFFEIFSDFGLSPFMLREIVRHKRKTSYYLNNFLFYKFFFALVAVIIPIIAIFFVKGEDFIRWALVILAVGYFFYYLREFIGTVFQAHEKMEYYSLINIIERICVASIIFVLLVLGFGIIAISLAFTLSYILTCIIAYFILSKKFVRIRLKKIDMKFVKESLKNALPFWLTSVFIIIYFRIGIIILSIMQGYNVVGWYNAAYRALETLYFIPAAVIGAVFPAMSKFYLANHEHLKMLFNKAAGYLFMFGLLMGLLITLFSKELVLLIYGTQFENTAIALKIIIWAGVAIFLSSLMAYFLNSINKQKNVTWVTGIAVLVNIPLNIVLIKQFSYIGASIAALVTEIIILILMAFVIFKADFPIYYMKIFPRPIIAGMIMLLICLFLKEVVGINFIINIIISMALYFLVLICTKFIGKDEFRLVKGLFGKGS